MRIFIKTLFVLLLVSVLFGFRTNKFISNSKTFLISDEKDTIIKTIVLQDYFNEFKETEVSNNIDLELEISESKLFRFYAFDPVSIPSTIFITPGDSIKYKYDIIKKTIVFEGINSAHYNFFNSLSELKLIYPSYENAKTNQIYKTKIDEVYFKKVTFFKQYCKEKNVSLEFKNKIKEVLKFEYLNKLFSPIDIPNDKQMSYFDLFDNINYGIFNRIDQNDNNYFYLTLTKYINLRSKIKNEKGDYNTENLNIEATKIKKFLNGDIEEYALLKLLNEYSNKIESYEIDKFLPITNEYIFQFKNKVYKQKVILLKENLIKLKSKIPAVVLSSKLIDSNGEEITFSEILKQNDKTKIIDFWASWCAPCLEELKNNIDFTNKLIKENNNYFVYFSIDTNIEAWKKKVDELNKLGLPNNHYLIINSKKSELAKYFELNSIPRISVIDNKSIVSMKAPLLSNNLEFIGVLNQIKN